ncbi:hypothetical protein Bateq7PJ16_0203 [Bacillus subtilis]|nr:hypothetical protein Bateq7PJ16_0203 [Bacillus subtilis]
MWAPTKTPTKVNKVKKDYGMRFSKTLIYRSLSEDKNP